RRAQAEQSCGQSHVQGRQELAEEARAAAGVAALKVEERIRRRQKQRAMEQRPQARRAKAARQVVPGHEQERLGIREIERMPVQSMHRVQEHPTQGQAVATLRAHHVCVLHLATGAEAQAKAPGWSVCECVVGKLWRAERAARERVIVEREQREPRQQAEGEPRQAQAAPWGRRRSPYARRVVSSARARRRDGDERESAGEADGGGSEGPRRGEAAQSKAERDAGPGAVALL